MDGVSEFFSTKYFMPHGHCYLWNPTLLWMQVLSNGAIGLSYVAISGVLTYLVLRIRDIPFRLMYFAFGIFIITCGITHLFDVWVIWRPDYWTDAVLRTITAIASVGTALMLPPLIPKAVALARGAKAAHERGIALETVVRDLGTLYEKTRELDELKTQFFANVSHELRTPLTLILGPTEKLLADPTLDESQRWQLDLVARNARALLKHVNDLLDVSKLDAGKLKPKFSSFDLAGLVRRTAAHFDGVARDRKLRYAVDVPSELRVEADRDQLERILLNLLSNAFKFTPSGGAIRVALARDDHNVALRVSDSGPGVPVQQRQLVFERFRQADGGTTRQQGGTGLGLAIVRDFAELHRGRVWVADAPEGGALFTVELPLKAPEGTPVELILDREDAEVVARAAVDTLSAEVRQIERDEGKPAELPLVLVVEDNPDMLRFTAEVLASEFRVEHASDGEEGLRKTEALRPDVVVSDVMMPRMSGDQLVQAIRSRPELDRIPILMLTAKADEELRLKMLASGAQDYVMKPFRAEELQVRVRNLAAVKRARDVLQSELSVQMQDLEGLAREVATKKRELQLALEATRLAKEHALEASAARSNLLRLVSHEVRTPLTVIQLQLDRLQARDSALSPEQLARVRKISGSAKRLLHMMESLLELSRLESGKRPLMPSDFDPAELCREIVDEVVPRAEEKGLTVRCEAKGHGTLHSDRSVLQMAISNLVDNALKYTEQGEVLLATERRGDGWVISVSDTGRGIALEHQQQIFEPFEQLEQLRHKSSPGVGLGLSIVKEAVESLGGTVELESSPGMGSRFTVSLRSMPRG